MIQKKEFEVNSIRWLLHEFDVILEMDWLFTAWSLIDFDLKTVILINFDGIEIIVHDIRLSILINVIAAKKDLYPELITDMNFEDEILLRGGEL